MGEFEGQKEVAKSEMDAARARIENARMTRRQALRKFGFTAGMAAFAMVSMDDLARIASKKLQENEATKGIGDTLAKEFRTAGVVLAEPTADGPYGGTYAQANPWGPGCARARDCMICCSTRYQQCRDRGGGTILCGTYKTACTEYCAEQDL